MSKYVRDESHMEQVVRWANYIKKVPREEWKKKQIAVLDAQILMARRFRMKLNESEEGKETLKRLKEERKKFNN
jgi:hypothetical protein